MKREDIIREKCDTENHFKVPDGYFDSLTDNIMDKLPERKAVVIDIRTHKSAMHKILVACSVAAACCAAFFCIQFLTHTSLSDQGGTAQQNVEKAHEKFVDDALDYSMIENHEIYDYLSDAE
jgi:hypothetical protein